MSNTDDYVRKWAGVLAMTIADQGTGIIRAGRLPTNVVIEDNVDIEKITGTDSLGRETNVGSNVRAFKPTMTLTYSGQNIDLYALQRGRKVARATLNDLVLPKEMQITKASYVGATDGKVGFGIAADATAKASMISDTLDNVALTQQPFATFVATTAKSFAIGANFARKFSDDLVAAKAFVHIEVPLPATTSARYVSEESLGAQIITLLVKSTNDTVSLIRVPTAQIDPSGSRFDPKAETLEVKFDLSGLGTCEPYKVYELATKIYCDA